MALTVGDEQHIRRVLLFVNLPRVEPGALAVIFANGVSARRPQTGPTQYLLQPPMLPDMPGWQEVWRIPKTSALEQAVEAYTRTYAVAQKRMARAPRRTTFTALSRAPASIAPLMLRACFRVLEAILAEAPWHADSEDPALRLDLAALSATQAEYRALLAEIASGDAVRQARARDAVRATLARVADDRLGAAAGTVLSHLDSVPFYCLGGAMLLVEAPGLAVRLRQCKADPAGNGACGRLLLSFSRGRPRESCCPEHGAWLLHAHGPERVKTSRRHKARQRRRREEPNHKALIATGLRPSRHRPARAS